MSTLFILGNGFDIDLGFDTRFSDYINSIHFQGNNNDILGLKHNSNRNELIDIANHLESIAKTDLWFDLEKEIVNYYKNLLSPSKIGVYVKSENEKIIKKLIVHKQHIIPIIKKSITDFLITEVTAKYNNYKIPKNENSKSAILLRKMLIEILGKNSSRIITFNYTGNIILKNELIKLIPVDYKKNIDDNKITQIHGNINLSDKTDNLVFGSTDTEINDESIATFLDKTRQPSIETSFWSKQFFEGFKTFVIFGHSFGETDSYFFKNFIDHFIENKKVQGKEIYIYTSENGRETIISKIHEKYARYADLTAYTKIKFNDEDFLNDKIVYTSYEEAFRPKDPMIQVYNLPK